MQKRSSLCGSANAMLCPRECYRSVGKFVGSDMMANLVGGCELKYVRFVCDEKRSTEDIVQARTQAFCLMRFAARSAEAHKKEHWSRTHWQSALQVDHIVRLFGSIHMGYPRRWKLIFKWREASSAENPFRREFHVSYVIGSEGGGRSSTPPVSKGTRPRLAFGREHCPQANTEIHLRRITWKQSGACADACVMCSGRHRNVANCRVRADPYGQKDWTHRTPQERLDWFDARNGARTRDQHFLKFAATARVQKNSTRRRLCRRLPLNTALRSLTWHCFITPLRMWNMPDVDEPQRDILGRATCPVLARKPSMRSPLVFRSRPLERTLFQRTFL